MSVGNISDASLKYLEEHQVKALLEEAMHDLLIKLPEDPLLYLEKRFIQKTPIRLIVAGPPGSGKGTQCEMLAQKYGLAQICVGDLLHKECDSGSETGKLIAPYIQEGTLVPDNLFVDIVVQKLRDAESENVGWVLDGFPRTRAQAIYLQSVGISPQIFLYIDVPEDVAATRSLNRRMDPETSRIFNVDTLPPPDTMQVVTKVDDTREAIATRLKYFVARKDELIGCYAPFFVRIDGTQAKDDVLKEICEQVDSIDL